MTLDRTLVGARIPNRLEPVDVYIADGLIAEITPVGVEHPRGEVIDLAGRSLMPGLWDNHVHLSQWAAAARRLDVSTAQSAVDAAVLVSGAPRPGAGLPLVGTGFRDGLWLDPPTVAVLDAVAPDLPVVLISGDLHACWLNTVALERYLPGMTEGLVREDAAFAVQRMLNDVPARTVDDWVVEAGRAAAARGVVGIVDFEMAWNADDWRRRMSDGFDTQRIEFGIYPQHLDRALNDGYRSGDAITELLTVGSLKVITDGSLNTRTAYCYDPYPTGDRHPFGVLNVTPVELQVLMARAWAGGIRSAIHAIGDHANAVALDAFGAVGCAGSIEHAQLLAEADVARFAALGIIASVQPEHAMDDRDVADRYWASRTARSFPLRSLVDAGVRLALGSDAPVAPLDPWVAIGAATARGRDGREPWHPEQSISVDDAIAASTRTEVAVGESADLVATDVDPREVASDELRRMPVALTVLGGRVTHVAL